MIFKSTFRNTVKTLLRSVTFWLVFVLFAFILVRYGVQQVHYVISGVGIALPGYTPPEHLSFAGYISTIDNLVHAGSMMYPLGILAVITVTLVLNRDHGDQFFEIEKASGLKPSVYLLGRLSAVTAIIWIAQELLSLVVLQILVFGQGGVEGLSFTSYLVNSFLRLTFANICCALPQILFYVGLTYFIGTVFKNGVVASFCGFAHVVAFFVAFMLVRYEPSWEVYFEYLSPMPHKLRHFIAFVGTETAEQMYARYSTSLSKALLCVGFLVGVCAVSSIVSYVLTRIREV